MTGSVTYPVGLYRNNTSKTRDLIESAVTSRAKNFIF